VDARVVLRAYHEQVRRCPQDLAPGYLVEREPGIVRLLRDTGGWAGVICTELQGLDVERAIAAQIERFAGYTGRWEWKHYSYDEPAELPQRLLAAGFEAEPTEALLVAELTELDLSVEPPPGIELVEVSDAERARTLVALQDEVFGSDSPGMAESLIAGLAREPAYVAATMALADAEPIAGMRVEFEPGTDFASLWGGCTRADWRGRGVARALLAHQAGLAAERGFRYLQADASEMSEPILKRVGFVELCKTTPYVIEPVRLLDLAGQSEQGALGPAPDRTLGARGA